jgi:hypothetical protein
VVKKLVSTKSDKKEKQLFHDKWTIAGQMRKELVIQAPFS